MKIYVIKNCLTKGIIEIDTEKEKFNFKIRGEVLIQYHSQHRQVPISWLRKGEWYLTRERAVEKANEIRKKEIKKATNRINKLKKLKF